MKNGPIETPGIREETKEDNEEEDDGSRKVSFPDHKRPPLKQRGVIMRKSMVPNEASSPEPDLESVETSASPKKEEEEKENSPKKKKGSKKGDESPEPNPVPKNVITR